MTHLAWFWLRLYVCVILGCQLLLLFEFIGGLRVLVRTATFGMSLAMLVWLRGQSLYHPARPWGIAILGILGLAFLHPTTPSLPVAAAQFMLYLAILAPLFWVTRLNIDTAVLRRLLLMLWGFHSLSALFGVLQIYFPGQFQPKVSDNVLGMGALADGLKVTLADGAIVWRPMGLTDLPGGAASAGLIAMSFGLGFFLSGGSMGLRMLSLLGMSLGLFCIYLSHIRSILLMALICCLSFVLVLVRRGEVGRSMNVLTLVAGLVVGTFFWAVAVGGQGTYDRITSLFAADPRTVYYKNRGHFLEQTFQDQLVEYPAGAGLGRWGMMRYYFGDPIRNAENPALWVEIQWTGWLYDGGIPLMIAYSVALLISVLVSYRIAVSRLPDGLPVWGMMIFAYNIAVLAVTFNYPIFISQGGMEFWLLNGCLFTAAVHSRGASAVVQPATPGAGGLVFPSPRRVQSRAFGGNTEGFGPTSRENQFSKGLT